MSLSPDFRFSQNNLQDYLDCQRRFELRYILRLAWPALESEPVLEQEQRMAEGQKFHKMVQQFIAGLPPEVLTENAQDSASVAQWWANFIQYEPLDGLPERRFVEHYLSCTLGGYRLAAQYDLLAVDTSERAVIVDWKTSARKPKREFLKNRLQTRVYPFVLVAAGAQLNDGTPIQPDQVEMVYWFPEFPEHPERFKYDDQQFKTDQTYLTGLIAEINQLSPGRFLLTPDEKKCIFCNYRSLCNRGEKAGDWNENELDDSPAPETVVRADLDFEQIGEIEF